MFDLIVLDLTVESQAISWGFVYCNKMSKRNRGMEIGFATSWSFAKIVEKGETPAVI